MITAITDVYDKDIQKSEVKKAKENVKANGGGSVSSGESEKERKARERAEKKAAAEARKREAEAKRKQKQAADSIKAETNQLMADNAKAYAEGKTAMNIANCLMIESMQLKSMTRISSDCERKMLSVRG